MNHGRSSLRSKPFRIRFVWSVRYVVEYFRIVRRRPFTLYVASV
jgi:hypothetical protein